MYQYPDAIYLEFQSQLSDSTDTYQVRNFDTIYPIITMRYTSCNINDQTIEPQSYQNDMFGQSLAIWIECIVYYGMVCVVLEYLYTNQPDTCHRSLVYM